jgi:NAD(P)-dependent dehydrogenase (short-subunit alcohol dehydrogenase family)
MTVGAELCWDIGYNAAKAALNAVTVRTAGLLASTGVIVVAVHPGWVRTGMGGPEATLSPERAAAQLMQTIDGLTAGHSGMFLDQTGAHIPGRPSRARRPGTAPAPRASLLRAGPAAKCQCHRLTSPMKSEPRPSLLHRIPDATGAECGNGEEQSGQ